MLVKNIEKMLRNLHLYSDFIKWQKDLLQIAQVVLLIDISTHPVRGIEPATPNVRQPLLSPELMLRGLGAWDKQAQCNSSNS